MAASGVGARVVRDLCGQSSAVRASLSIRGDSSPRVVVR